MLPYGYGSISGNIVSHINIICTVRVVALDRTACLITFEFTQIVYHWLLIGC